MAKKSCVQGFSSQHLDYNSEKISKVAKEAGYINYAHLNDGVL